MNNRTRLYSDSYASDYEYVTESYDFKPYQSLDTLNARSEQRGFRYNESIGNDQNSIGDSTGGDMNINEFQS